jgi:hypothetical protein
VELIVRSAQNRKLADEDYLFDAPFDWHELGSKDVRVPPSQPGDAGRVARVSVKAGCVCICRPRNGASPADPANATLTYVEVNETNIMLLLWLNKMCETRSQVQVRDGRSCGSSRRRNRIAFSPITALIAAASSPADNNAWVKYGS